MPEGPMTQRQLRAVVYRLAITYLEVERGLRDPDQLQRFLSPTEYLRHRAIPRAPTTAAPPVHPSDIGRIRIDAAKRNRVNASAMVRRDDDGWSALLVDLRQTGRGWQVERLDRLERFTRQQVRQPEVTEGSDLTRRIRHIEGERRLATAARDAVARRIQETGDRRTKVARELRPELDRWARRVDELEVERADLESTGRLRRQHRGDSVLGQRPREPRQAELWDGAAQALRTYRQRWGLDEEEPVLGPSSNVDQDAERQELVEHLRRVVQALVPSGSDAAQDLVVDHSQASLGIDS